MARTRWSRSQAHGQPWDREAPPAPMQSLAPGLDYLTGSSNVHNLPSFSHCWYNSF